jgi:hypothetical protein
MATITDPHGENAERRSPELPAPRSPLPALKIAIVGTAPDSSQLAPWGDPTWTIWVLGDNAHRGAVARWDAVFELHDHDFPVAEPAQHAWMQTARGKPLFMQRQRPEYPDSVRFPREDLVAHFGRYFNSSIDWMLALAIRERPAEIGLWGVNMAHDSEYGTQRPSCEYFLGWCRGLGIKLHIPPQSDLLKSAGLYGYEEPVIDLKWKVRWDELVARYKECEKQRDDLESNMIFLKGALDDMKYWATWLQKNVTRS